MEDLTFKEKTHQELLGVLPKNKEEIYAFLAGLTKIAGSLEIVKGRMNLVLQLDNYEEGLKVIELFKELYPAEFELNIETAKSGKNQGKRICSILVPYGFTKQVLFDFYLMSEEGDQLGEFIQGAPKKLLQSREDKEAFLKGLFMGCGSIYVPSMSQDEKKEGYHFEFQIDDETYLDDVVSLVEEFGINLKKSERGESFLLYLKDKESVLQMLIILGLSDSALYLQSIINERETANNLNRTIICETANLDKTYAAAAKQLQAIGEISEKIGLDNLPMTLKEVADARLENEKASLQELADIIGITKSCLNHRFRKLIEMADEL